MENDDSQVKGEQTTDFKKPAFKKKKVLKKNIRKRKQSSSDDDDTKVEKVQVAQKKINAFQTSSTGRKSQPSSLQQAGIYESTREVVPVKYAGDATYITEVDTEKDRDARAIAERNLKMNEEGQTNDETKIYRGQAGYKNYIQKKESQIGGNKYTGTQGPIRAPTNIRAICRFDYQPDICKDYKETGFCGYGDNCKFIHDRGDYKTGWQLEKEWEEEQKKKKEREMMGMLDGSDEEEDNPYLIDSDDELPFACHICRDDFVDPIVTLCGHYFCGPCALEQYKTNPRCAICEKQTSGIFNQAKKLVAKLKLRRSQDTILDDDNVEEAPSSLHSRQSSENRQATTKKGSWTVVEEG
mmetsp:Transcript_1088/g.1534  ORF Transcript_1088/g.1534 Transcript_1088/m.1534 type:complete len:354 (+) Transcript_1088:110-1171(+)